MPTKTGAGGQPQEYDKSTGQFGNGSGIRDTDDSISSHYKWAINNGVVSPLISESLYKKIRNLIRDIAIGKQAADGTTIREVTNHCVDRLCGTTEKTNGVKHEGISIIDFRETLFHGEVEYDTETNTIIFISEKCKIAIDPQKGRIKQCNRL